MAPSYRPDNHVTRAMHGPGLKAPGPQFAVIERCPEVTHELLQFLRDAFPPRVYNHRGESLEDHLTYAGYVGLVEYLEAAHEYQREEMLADNPEPEAEGTSTVTVDIPETPRPYSDP